MSAPPPPVVHLCTCSLTEAGKALEAHCARLGELAGKELQKEWRQAAASWKLLYHQHVTEYREALQMALLNHVKASALEAMPTTLHTAGAIREARKPATRKKKRDKRSGPTAAAATAKRSKTKTE